MTLTLAKADLSARDGADALTVESLRGDLSGRPEPEWLASARRARLVEFLESDRSFGRYSRLKLDWASLPPTSARFEVDEGAHAGSTRTAGPIRPLERGHSRSAQGEEWRKLVRPSAHGTTSSWQDGGRG